MMAGFPHSEIADYNGYCLLVNAYRRLSRPSSPLTAKASTVCAYSLDHIVNYLIIYYKIKKIVNLFKSH
jgi:hypothetical protein